MVIAHLSCLAAPTFAIRVDKIGLTSRCWFWKRGSRCWWKRLGHRIWHGCVAIHGIRSLRGDPSHWLPVGYIVAIATGIEFDTHTAWLAEVQIALFTHTMCAGSILN